MQPSVHMLPDGGLQSLRLMIVVILCLLSSLPATASSVETYPIPNPLTLTVRETAGVGRTNEIVRSGVPLPRSLGVRDTTTLAIVDAGGHAIPAEFRALARWSAGRNDASAAIQWLLVAFPVTVAANGSSTYRLVIDGSAGPNPAPETPLSLTQVGNRVTVNTGAGIFVVGGSSEALFDEIRRGDGTLLVSGSALTATVNGGNTTHPTTRRVTVEHVGPLTAVVVVAGAYDLAPVGGGGLGSTRRYVFAAGSPTAIVRHAVAWEGDLCPTNGWDLTCDADGDGQPEANGVLVSRVRDTLHLTWSAPYSVMAVAATNAAAVQGTAAAGQEAWVRQTLRADRTAALAFDVWVPGTMAATGQKADEGILAVSGTPGTVAIAFDHMHRYEPQALRLLPDGRLSLDLAGDRAWLGQRQGLFATLAVSVLPSGPGRADLDRLTWAPLNHPLHAWPSPEWFAASAAVDEVAVGDLPVDVAAFDPLASQVLTDTLLRASELTGEDDLRTMGADLTHLALSAVQAERPVLNKIAGLYFARLPPAVAILARQDDPPSPPVLAPTSFLPLVWQHRSPNRSYEVHGSATPYFTPGPATLRTTIIPPFGDPLSYQDAVATSPRFYYVVGVNAAGQPASSGHLGRFEIRLMPGE